MRLGRDLSIETALGTQPRGAGRACHNGEIPSWMFTIPFSVGPPPPPDCAGILGK